MIKVDIARGVSFATLGSGLFSFLGPGYHWSKTLGPSTADSIREGRLIGVIFGVLGIGLGVLAYRLYRRRTDKVEFLWGKIGVVVSSLGVLFWLSILVMNRLP